MVMVVFVGNFCFSECCVCLSILVGNFCEFVFFPPFFFLSSYAYGNTKHESIRNWTCAPYPWKETKWESDLEATEINLSSNLPLTSVYNTMVFFLIQDSSKVYTTHVSYLEIYNECGYDLLDPRHEASKMEDLP